MKKLILTLSILLITIISYGQHQTISVNGIELDKKYTQSQIYNILSTPKSIKPNEFDAWYSRYYYNNSSFALGHEDWDLLAFTIKEYRDNVAYIQIIINKQTKIIKMIGLLTVKFHDYY